MPASRVTAADVLLDVTNTNPRRRVTAADVTADVYMQNASTRRRITGVYLLVDVQPPAGPNAMVKPPMWGRY